ncbi:MAG: cyclase family protein, partial [Planctomycetota bacterium]
MIHDISPLLDSDVAVWPGDSPYSAEDLLRIEDGSSVHLSTIRMSCHTGAHADAPCHFVEGGPGIDAADLAKYIGPCVLIDVGPEHRAVRPEDLPPMELPPRILLRTGAMKDRTVFPDPLTHLTVELIEFLAARGCVLIGL